MNIYVGHSNSFNYRDDLYKPFRESNLDKIHNIVLPHEKSTAQYNSKDFLKTCDLMIAEVSHPSTGLGMELGWAFLYKVPIIAIHKADSKVSGSLSVVTNDFITYKNAKDMIDKLSKYMNREI